MSQTYSIIIYIIICIIYKKLTMFSNHLDKHHYVFYYHIFKGVFNFYKYINLIYICCVNSLELYMTIYEKTE